MSHSPTFRILTILIILLISACGSLKNGNFNRQKYTKLKKVEAYSEPVSTTEDEVSKGPNFEGEEITQEETPLSDHINTGFDVEPATVEGVIQPSSYPLKVNEETSLEEEIILPEKMIWGNPDAPGNKDFKTFSQDEKNQAIIEFNALFNAGLGILITAALLFIFAGVLSFGSSSFIMFAFVIAACVFLFVAWIISLVALNKVRRIKKANFVGDLGVKVWLARLVAFIGIATCIITLLGGFVLGILYLARLI